MFSETYRSKLETFTQQRTKNIAQNNRQRNILQSKTPSYKIKDIFEITGTNFIGQISPKNWYRPLKNILTGTGSIGRFR